MSREIHQKWGFGMAPPKPETEASRSRAAVRLMAFLDADTRDDELPDALSEMKGLFARIARQDQWDWFSTSRTLGYPSARMARVIAETIGAARRALVSGDTDLLRKQRSLPLAGRSLNCAHSTIWYCFAVSSAYCFVSFLAPVMFGVSGPEYTAIGRWMDFPGVHLIIALLRIYG